MSLKKKYNKAAIKTHTEENLFEGVHKVIERIKAVNNAEAFVDTMDGTVFFVVIETRKIVFHFIMPAQLGMFCKKRDLLY